MKRKIVFYNPCQSGDIHVSRTYIRDIVELLQDKCDFYYAQNRTATRRFLLEDIENLSEDLKDNHWLNYHKFQPFFEEDDIIYINTWYAVENYKYFRLTNTHNCNFHILYAVFKDIYRHLSLDMKEFNFYFPSIDYSKIEIHDLNTEGYSKTVLCCINDVMSGQAPNFSLNNIINSIAKEYTDIAFIVTGEMLIDSPNIFSAADLNLNQISYLSKKSSIIIGRSSGPYTFTITKENLFDSTKTFVCFTTDKIISLGLLETDDRNCKLIWSNNFNEDNVRNKIVEAL